MDFFVMLSRAWASQRLSLSNRNNCMPGIVGEPDRCPHTIVLGGILRRLDRHGFFLPAALRRATLARHAIVSWGCGSAPPGRGVSAAAQVHAEVGRAKPHLEPYPAATGFAVRRAQAFHGASAGGLLLVRGSPRQPVAMGL